MDLKSLHTYIGKLLDAGVSPQIPVVAITGESLREIDDVELLQGEYHADMAPKLVIGTLNETMFVLVPIGEDKTIFLNGSQNELPSHKRLVLPIEPPHKF